MLHLLAQAATSPPPAADDDMGMGPMLIPFMLIAGLITCAALAVAILACICLFALALLLAAGIFSATLTSIGISSVFIGLLRGRFFAFFHAFCLQIAAVLGILGGLGIGTGVKFLAHDVAWLKALGCGALAGGLAGALAGHLFAKLCRWVVVLLAEAGK